jgi:hypothetical protein
MIASRRRVAPVADGISVVVAYHGSEHGPLRDPVIQAFSLHGSFEQTVPGARLGGRWREL